MFEGWGKGFIEEATIQNVKKKLSIIDESSPQGQQKAEGIKGTSQGGESYFFAMLSPLIRKPSLKMPCCPLSGFPTHVHALLRWI